MGRRKAVRPDDQRDDQGMPSRWMIYATHGLDAIGTASGFGDGITRSSCRLYAVCDSEAEARKALARFLRTRIMTRPRVPGDGIIYPVLEVGPFKPLMFIPRQGRHEIVGERYKALIGGLPVLAERTAASLD